MFKLRLAILGAAAALALGTAGAMAMQEADTTNADSHGDAVASAARNCPHGAGGVHGACVSSVARAEAPDNQTPEANSTSPAQTCKASDTNEDAGETAPAKADKTAKAAAKAEDKAEHKTFAACVSASASDESGSADEASSSDESSS